VLSAEPTRRELGVADTTAFRTWRFVPRFIAPLAVGWVLVASLR
jgi:hypothetical protein